MSTLGKLTPVEMAPPDPGRTATAVGTDPDRRRNIPETLAVLIPAVVSALLILPFLGHAALYRDEAATLSASTRPLGRLSALLAHLDLVHGFYYFVFHFWLLVSVSPWWIRLPGGIAAIAAVALTARIGVRFGGPLCGLVAGLIAAGSHLYLQEATLARSYPFAVLLVTVVAYVALEAVRTHRQRPSALLIGLGILAPVLHLLAAGLPTFVVLAAAVYLGRQQGSSVRVFVAPLVATGVAVVAVAAATYGQASDQIGYLKAPGLTVPFATARDVAGNNIAMVVLGVAVVGGLYAARRNQMTLMLLAWAVVPPAAVFVFSHVANPTYSDVYFVSAVVPLAILAGYGVSAAAAKWSRPPGARAVLPAVLLAAVAVVPVYVSGIPFAASAVHTDDPRSVAAVVARSARPGDVVVYAGALTRDQFAYTFSAKTRRELDDVLLVKSPSAAANYTGQLLPFADSARLAAAPRIWLLETLSDNKSRAPAGLLSLLNHDRHITVRVVGGQVHGTLFQRGS